MKHFENFLECVRSRKQPRLRCRIRISRGSRDSPRRHSYRESRMMVFDGKMERVVSHAPKRPGYEGTGEEYVEPHGSLPDGRVANHLGRISHVSNSEGKTCI